MVRAKKADDPIERESPPRQIGRMARDQNSGRLSVYQGISTQEAEWIRLRVQGKCANEAAKLAGYSRPLQSAADLAGNPRVQAALQEAWRQVVTDLYGNATLKLMVMMRAGAFDDQPKMLMSIARLAADKALPNAERPETAERQDYESLDDLEQAIARIKETRAAGARTIKETQNDASESPHGMRIPDDEPSAPIIDYDEPGDDD